MKQNLLQALKGSVVCSLIVGAILSPDYGFTIKTIIGQIKYALPYMFYFIPVLYFVTLDTLENKK